ncbi:DNA dC-_dU-editing enzyme APOBEC-3B-like [Trichechus manatus latirostris]|uniref:DNA dC->dU-editing enzyme APOBEC-3B-like n=1 Tax=Trichechus manatus latirostris TaxID=127582 RepID=A0A2Y9QZB6_TRIMA|nr:DNA dC->dU-editing enzyme APOBEC-3B-like [Trichechus manatus latirostris]
MDTGIFLCYFSNDPRAREQYRTYLCYEVELLDGNSWVLLYKSKGFLPKQLDPAQCHRVTWFMSRSPCPDCAREVTAFLGKNSHVHLHIFAASIYDYSGGYEEQLLSLWHAGAKIAIMTPTDLMHQDIFQFNFNNNSLVCGQKQTYLCYEVELLDDNSWVLLEGGRGFLNNQLDPAQCYRVNCFMSRRPCFLCAWEVATFLGRNSHVSLHIFTSCTYEYFPSSECKHYWRTFVDNQGCPFEPWNRLDKNSQTIWKRLQRILQNEYY